MATSRLPIEFNSKPVIAVLILRPARLSHPSWDISNDTLADPNIAQDTSWDIRLDVRHGLYGTNKLSSRVIRRRVRWFGVIFSDALLNNCRFAFHSVNCVFLSAQSS